MTQHEARVRMQHMLSHATEAVELLGEREVEAVEANRTLQLALTRLVEVVGEAASKVSPDIKAAHPDIPWRQATSMRNLLIHGYDIVRIDILCNTIREDLPTLIEALRRALAE